MMTQLAPNANWPAYTFQPQPRTPREYQSLTQNTQALSSRIMDFVADTPGTYATFVAESLGCKYKSTASKMSKLVKNNLLIVKQGDLFGRNKHLLKQYWVNGVVQ